MKKIILLSLTMLFALTLKAQQKLSYAYDASGNRVDRAIVLGATLAKSTMKTDSVYFTEILAEKQVKIYPNPVESELTISIDGFESSIQGEYSLFTLTGSRLVEGNISSGSIKIDMSKQSRGTYILNIQVNGQSSSWKVIKQ